jgi:CheY-like chemotaxis protein
MPIDIEEFEEKQSRILIVDDDVTIQEYLKTILGGLFTQVEVVSDGFEAGIKVMEFKPHLIILDLFMPRSDGFQVCKSIKENPATSRIKILVMTGHGTTENRDKAFLLGADAFLSKPSSMKEIISQVERLLK